MPNQRNTERRHPIAKMKFRVTNWAEYDPGLRRRRSHTLWVTEEVMDRCHAALDPTVAGKSSCGTVRH